MTAPTYSPAATKGLAETPHRTADGVRVTYADGPLGGLSTFVPPGVASSQEATIGRAFVGRGGCVFASYRPRGGVWRFEGWLRPSEMGTGARRGAAR